MVHSNQVPLLSTNFSFSRSNSLLFFSVALLLSSNLLSLFLYSTWRLPINRSLSFIFTHIFLSYLSSPSSPRPFHFCHVLFPFNQGSLSAMVACCFSGVITDIFWSFECIHGPRQTPDTSTCIGFMWFCVYLRTTPKYFFLLVLFSSGEINCTYCSLTKLLKWFLIYEDHCLQLIRLLYS